MNRSLHHSRQSGSSMIEVLVTLIILMVGLLGLAGLQAQGLRSEMESYQRVQALILLQDMVERINANRKVAACYVTTGLTPYLGTNAAGTGIVAATVCAAALPATAAQQIRAQQDMDDWSNLLAGAAEKSDGTNVGAMIGARGCVSYDAFTLTYMVSVAWQGLGKTFANTALLCGQGQYGTDDAQRRVISLPITIATLL